MTIAAYFEQKTKERRAQLIAEGYAEGRAEMRAWYARKREVEAGGEPFDEPQPGSEEAERIRREAIESSVLYRLRRHWVWPHLMILFVVCLVIGVIAMGFGIEWIVRYIAGIKGSGTAFLILTLSLLPIGAYRLLYGTRKNPHTRVQAFAMLDIMSEFFPGTGGRI